jgi:hypothetical protein
MARISEVMVAFLEGRGRKVNAHETDGETYWLHGHAIARKDGRTFVIDACGYPTVTTFAVLNQIASVGGDRLDRYGDGMYHGLHIVAADGAYKWDGARRAWDGGPTKLKMKEVFIGYGLPKPKFKISGGGKRGPDYNLHDPVGWCGDSMRGAALGRCALHVDGFDGRLYVKRVRLDGDYDCNGTYFGGGVGGRPLWWCASIDCEVDYMLRGRSLHHAKVQVRERYPDAQV